MAPFSTGPVRWQESKREMVPASASTAKESPPDPCPSGTHPEITQ